jgi:hypothetical protein
MGESQSSPMLLVQAVWAQGISTAHWSQAQMQQAAARPCLCALWSRAGVVVCSQGERRRVTGNGEI